MDEARFIAVPQPDAQVLIGLSLGEDEDDILVTLDVDSAEEFALQVLGAVTLSSYFDIVKTQAEEAGEEN